MEFVYFFGNIELHCIIEQSEIDCYDPSNGHYTKPGDFFVYSVSHKGQDITEIIEESILDDIVEEFTQETGEI